MTHMPIPSYSHTGCGFERPLRLALVIMLAECAFVVWLLEQPSGSTDTLPYHPRLDALFNQWIYATCLNHIHCEFLRLMKTCSYLFYLSTYVTTSIAAEVWRQEFWMMHWGAECPKRTAVWSSDANIIHQLVSAL